MTKYIIPMRHPTIPMTAKNLIASNARMEMISPTIMIRVMTTLKTNVFVIFSIFHLLRLYTIVPRYPIFVDYIISAITKSLIG